MTDTINPVAAAVSEAVYRQGIAPENADDFADALIEWLSTNGYAVVKLPEMVVDKDGVATWPVPQPDDRPGTVRIRHADGLTYYTSVHSPMTGDTAATLGAALIAAAKHLEEKVND